MKNGRHIAIVLAALLRTAVAAAQADAPEAKTPPRPPEGERIINLPSADVPRPGTLSLFFTHRFSLPIEQSDIHSLYSFDSGADIGIGLAYAPIQNLDVSFYRSTNLDVYELDAKYKILAKGPLAVALRAGGDWRTENGLDNRFGFFAQTIVAFSIGSRVRFTAVPTYVSKTAGPPFITLKPFYKDVFNLGGAVSIGVTRSINVQSEVIARRSKTDSGAVSWICSIEKTVPGHRFAFTVGNQRATTVDQYVAWNPEFFGQSAHAYFIGFNIVRQWKL